VFSSLNPSLAYSVLDDPRSGGGKAKSLMRHSQVEGMRRTEDEGLALCAETFIHKIRKKKLLVKRKGINRLKGKEAKQGTPEARVLDSRLLKVLGGSVLETKN